MIMNDNKKLDVRYLQLLAQSFPSVADASTEIINLQAILNLPKGTEHFLADLHGEYEAFQHVLKTHPVISNAKLANSLVQRCVRQRSENSAHSFITPNRNWNSSRLRKRPRRLVSYHNPPSRSRLP